MQNVYVKTSYHVTIMKVRYKFTMFGGSLFTTTWCILRLQMKKAFRYGG
jgi:hypothetical protein